MFLLHSNLNQTVTLLAGFNTICGYHSTGAYFFGPPSIRLSVLQFAIAPSCSWSNCRTWTLSVTDGDGNAEHYHKHTFSILLLYPFSYGRYSTLQWQRKVILWNASARCNNFDDIYSNALIKTVDICNWIRATKVKCRLQFNRIECKRIKPNDMKSYEIKLKQK